jgi:hypothetical protein
MSTEDVLNRLDHAKKELAAVLQTAPRKRARGIKEILALLDYFELLQWAVDQLWDDLEDNNVWHADNLSLFSDDKDLCDLIAAVIALDKVIDFLRFSPGMPSINDRRKRFKILHDLRQVLFDLSEGGAPAPMLRPGSNPSGRPADVSTVLAMKGILAALMHLKQRAGMARLEAAKWIADNVSPKFASRISRKPITPRMVEEWLDRFGGKHAEQDAARKAYLVWSDYSAPLTKERFRTLTERIATGDF